MFVTSEILFLIWKWKKDFEFLKNKTLKPKLCVVFLRKKKKNCVWRFWENPLWAQAPHPHINYARSLCFKE